MGSSKGGTCAIYYGLMFGATDIYAGACQYYIGKYLNVEERVRVFKSMMGKNATPEGQEILDKMLFNQLCTHRNSKSRIHLLYSKEEHTYSEHIQYLIADIEKNGIKHVDKIENFTDHGEVGEYFSPWIKHELKNINNNG